MNKIVTQKRNLLTSKLISSLLIQYVGLHTDSFMPNYYTKSWIISGKKNSKITCPKKTNFEDEKQFMELFEKIFNKYMTYCVLFIYFWFC